MVGLSVFLTIKVRPGSGYGRQAEYSILKDNIVVFMASIS